MLASKHVSLASCTQDRTLFGLSPLEAAEMDPQQLAVLEGHDSIVAEELCKPK